MTRTPRARSLAVVLAAIAVVAVAALLVGQLLSGRGPTSVGTSSPAPPTAATASHQGTGAPSSGATPGVTPGTTGLPGTTPGPGATPVGGEVFVGAGDIADCGSDGDSQTAAILDALPAAQVFTLGDNAYESGAAQEFEACYGPTWGRHRDRTWPSPGNHEYRTPGAAGYFGYFGERAGPPDEGWYAFDLGAWRIYSLNSNCDDIGGCGRDSRQVAWLRGDLAANPRDCTLAYMHHPRYSSGDHGSDEDMDAIWDVLHEAGAELVLAGHEHSYERFEPMNAAGELDRERGLVQFVVGTGGRRHYEFRDVLPTSAARSSGAWGVLELTLSPDGWSSRFIPVSGASYTDRAGGTCH